MATTGGLRSAPPRAGLSLSALGMGLNQVLTEVKIIDSKRASQLAS